MTKKDTLANVIAGELNKQFKHQQVAYFLGEQETPTDIRGFISTGSTILDLHTKDANLEDVFVDLTKS